MRSAKVPVARSSRSSFKSSIAQQAGELGRVDEFCAPLPDYPRGMVEFLYLTSWRAGEARSLKWGDVDLPNPAIRLRAERSKNRKARLIKLSGTPLQVIEYAATLRRPDFPNVLHDAGRALVDCRRAWKTACNAAGLSGLLLHDLRRSGIRNMIRSCIVESVSMKISGHKTRTTFERIQHRQ